MTQPGKLRSIFSKEWLVPCKLKTIGPCSCVLAFAATFLFLVFGMWGDVVFLHPAKRWPVFPYRSGDQLFSEEGVRPKVILFWTSFFGVQDFYVGYGKMPFSSCSVQNCITTSDRSLLNLSDAVIFHIRDTNLDDLPPYRFPHQRWVFFLLESPHHTPPLHNFANLFNWTMTYRSDSDIFHPYGSVVPLPGGHDLLVNIHNRTLKRKSTADLHVFHQLKHAGSNDVSFDYDSFIKHKTKGLAWFVSNCHTTSGREGYVEELAKYIDVDIYGKCGPLTCDDRRACSEMVGKDYKFYLAFENSLCPDYVTEKFYNALVYGIVPVALDGSSHYKLAPPKSFIDAKKFESPEALANYLHTLLKNDTLYKDYLLWNDKYAVRSYTPAWCSLCELLNSSNHLDQTFTYSDINHWWFGKGQCRYGEFHATDAF